MKKIYLFSFIFLLHSSLLFSQVAINRDGTAPNSSAGLDVNFTDKGFLLPRMTFDQRNAIENPAEGLIIYCTNCSADATGALSIYQGGLWRIFNINCFAPNKPSALDHVSSVTQIIWNWDAVPIALGYKWNTTNNCNTAIDLGNTCSYTESGLNCVTPYTRYLWSYNTCGESLELTLRDTTSYEPFALAPTEGNHSSNATMIGWTWNPVTGATGYKWNTTNNISTAQDMGNSILRMETDLSCNTSYTRYVWAYNGCSYSNPTTLTKSTTMSPPTAPTAGTHDPSPTQIVWNWSPVTGATGYRWNTINDSVNATNLGNVTSATETGLTCNTPQTSYVWAYSNCGVSPLAALSQTTSMNPPSPPTSATHIPSTDQIIWNWNAVAGATGYKWSTLNNLNGAEEMGTALTKTETGLFCNTSYTRFVWAYSACGTSTATILTQTSSINPPSPVTGTHVPSSTQIVWNWVAVPGASGYKWSATNDYTTAENMGTGLTKTQTGLTCNTGYTTYVWAYNACGNSTATSLMQTTSINPLSPSAGTHDATAIQVVWNWNAVPGATGYKWSATNNYDGAENMGTNLTKTETGLSCNTSYNRYVWADNACGHSTATTLTQTTSVNPPSPVAGTHGPSSTQIVWNWNAVPGATGYRWSTTNNYDGAENMGTNLTKTQTGLTCNTGYTTYVWTYNACGHSSATTLTQTTSVDPPSPSAGTHVPTTTQIVWNWIAVPGATGYKFNITNDYTGAEDRGTNLTKTQTGLTCNTGYTTYIWAYNACGHSTATTLTQTTSINPPAPSAGTHNPASNQIVWNWNSVTEATGYRWSATNNYAGAENMGTNMTKTQTGLSCNTGYTVYIWAYNGCGNSTATTLTQTTSVNPSSPSSGTHTATTTQIVWNWNTVSGATGYKWSSTNNFDGAEDMGSGLTKTQTGLTCNTAYTTYIWAYNSCGHSSATSLTKTTVINPSSPSSGTHVASPSQIVWNWIAVSGATGYKWNTVNNYAGAEDMGTGLTKTQTGLTCNTSYTTYVWAYNTCGNSTATTLSQTTSINPLSPTAGTHNPSTSQIVWNWNPSSGATGYKWSTTNNYAGAQDMGNTLSKTETGLSCNTSYTRYIWSYNACGNSNATTITQSTSINPTAPTAGTHIPSTTQIVWNWNAVPGATGYKWSTTNNYSGAQDMANTLSKTETGLNCNTSYTRYVWAYNTCGNSTETNLSETCSASPPSPSAGTHVPTTNQIVWNWIAVPGATGYKWSATNNYGGAVDMGTGLTRTQTGLTCNTGYTTYVWAYNACGHSIETSLTQTTSINPPSPAAGTHVPSATQIVWNWTAVPEATGYKWSTTNDYATAENMGTGLSKTESGLNCNTPYTRYAWAYNTCGPSSVLTLTQSTSQVPFSTAPTGATHLSTSSSIQWKWYPVAGATGYGWNTTNDYGSAIQITDTSYTESGLACNSTLTRYVWAHDNCGNSTATSLTKSTTSDPPAKPVAANHVATSVQIIWNWNAVSGAAGYKWSSTNNYGNATDMGTATSKTETGLACNSEYTRYVWAYNNCGNSASATLIQSTTDDLPETPTSGTHSASYTQIVWNWNTVSDAIGYKWNTTDDYASAIDMGNCASKTEINLTCSNNYTRYVWSYNDCGHLTPVTLNQSTLTCFSCGNSITINHVAGNVCPVDKSVTYGTVTNVPGETSKCWITSNLGADRQATAKDDATEASAGWYWQFNRMQGYKHDGTNRTPNTTWINYISEYSDWTSANDPCSLEFGNGWRIPTKTEWVNVDASGSWGTWTGPWGSALKLHAAGYLYPSTGVITNRGANGSYWSQTQSSVEVGWRLSFSSSNCTVIAVDKTFGNTLRCIKN